MPLIRSPCVATATREIPRNWHRIECVRQYNGGRFPGLRRRFLADSRKGQRYIYVNYARPNSTTKAINNSSALERAEPSGAEPTGDEPDKPDDLRGTQKSSAVDASRASRAAPDDVARVSFAVSRRRFLPTISQRRAPFADDAKSLQSRRISGRLTTARSRAIGTRGGGGVLDTVG